MSLGGRPDNRFGEGQRVAKSYLLLFKVRGYKEDLLFEVRRGTSERLRMVLGDREWKKPGFFHFDTVDGRTVAINLELVQAVRYLWEVTELPPDETRHDGLVLIHFRDSEEPLSAYTHSPEQLFDAFRALEDVPNGEGFPSFEDEDGEILQINAHEVVWIVAPTHLVDEGSDEILG